MTDHELAAFLHGQVGHDLDLELEDFEAAIAWLREDPVFRAARAQDRANAARADARATCSHARRLRRLSQNLRASGVTRRLVAGRIRTRPRKPPLPLR